jgi:N-acetylmuramoyl-L-alanine amidase
MRMRIQYAAFLTAALWATGSSAAHAAQIQAVALESGSSGTRAEIAVDAQSSFRTLMLSEPHRLVVDFDASSAAAGLKLPAASGIIKSVRTGTPSAGTFRVVFELSAPVQALPPQWVVGSRPTLVLQWPGAAGSVVTPSATASVSAAPAVNTASTPVAAPAVDPAAAALRARQEAARATALLTAGATRAAATPTPTPTPTPSPLQSAATAHSVSAGSPVASTPAAVAAGTGSASPAVTTPGPGSILQGAAVVTAPPPPSTGANEATPARAVVTPAAAPPPSRAGSAVAMGPGMRHLVVAIDAGHGGQDPGAVGPTGKHEKDVTLAVARELARQVNATPGLRAFMVRDSDVFIPLNARGARARQAKADIFISIHADAAENRNARGSSVYVLSTKGASSQRARWLADKENAADLIGGVRLQQTEGTLANVLLDLAQSGQLKASEEAAEQVLSGLKRIGNNHKPNIERANFAVLRTSDMPAMLVETAFISNPDEEKRLFQPAFQRQLAAAVLDGVHTYFASQPPPGTLFAARADAESQRTSSARGSP